MLCGIRAKVERHALSNRPRRIYDIQSRASGRKPRQVAEAFLRKIAKSLGITPDLTQLAFDRVKRTILGRHVLFQQRHAGKRISNAWIRVDLDDDGRVYNVHSDLVPDDVMRKTVTVARAEVGGADAEARAVQSLRKGPRERLTVASRERVYFPVGGVPRAAWKVVVSRAKPPGEWKVYVDASSGKMLDRVTLLKAGTPVGRVFDPNPVVALNDTSLQNDSLIADAAYTRVALRAVTPGGFLDGKFVSTRHTRDRVRARSGKFLFRRLERGFKEVMVYFHIDRAQRYLQDLGFDNVANKQIPVNVEGPSGDDSFYSPTRKSLTFGRGGVDDAEDAEIILHEYGHAIQDDQVPGFGSSSEGGAMGEGFGDYFAASFFADRKPDRLRPCVGSWDAVYYSRANPPALRRVDGKKKYPADLRRDVHDNGEIWSACLWQIRNALGRPTADRLIVAHHFLLTPKAKFEDGATALLLADERLNQGRNQAPIRTIFIRRGILRATRRKAVPRPRPRVASRRPRR